MNDGGGLEVFRGGSGLDLERVERELRGLWKQAAERVAEQGKPPVTRVATVNLVAWACGPDEAARAAETAVELSARHPGRLLLVEVGDDDAPLTASISAHCHLGGGERQVCSEQVHLQAGRAGAARAVSAVVPLLIPDLPVVLWVVGDPGRLLEESRWLTLADQVVVDAHRFADPAAALTGLVEWSERPGAARLQDLAWLRLERWRALTAELFDEPAARADLGRLREIEIEYLTGADGSPEGRAEALYYLGWMASRLGLEVAPPAGRGGGRNGVERFIARGGGRELALRARHREREGEAPGDLAAVVLDAGPEGCRYEIRRRPERETAQLLLQGPRSCPLPAEVGLESRSLADLVCNALESGGGERAYREALGAAHALAGGAARVRS